MTVKKPDDPPFAQKQRDLNVHEWSQPRSDFDTESVTAEEAKNETAREITEPGRVQHIKNARSRREELAAALREVEKTTPLKAGLKYIKNNVQKELPKHLPPGCRLPSEGELKGIVSMMKRGQL
jgi:hypothetical protein